MLISKSMEKVIRVVLNNRDKRLTIRFVAKEANLSIGIVSKILNKLKSTGFFKRKKVTNWIDLLKAWAYTRTIKELSSFEFNAAERPQYLIKKITNIANETNYAFTLYSATELIAPYVGPNKTHLYILKKDVKKIEDIFKKNNIFPAQKGNIICYPVEEDYFYNQQKIKGSTIVSLPQLYVDLFSLKGRGEEAAEKVLEVMKNV